MYIKNFLIIISFLFVTNLTAETFSKGSATIEIKRPKKISSEETALAKKKAVEAAWKRYTSKFNKSRSKQYILIEEDILSDIEAYINDIQVLDNTVDTGTKTLKTVVKISINEARLDAKLSLTSAAGGTASGEGSIIVAYYIMRETGGRKTFQAKETNIEANESAKKVTDSMEGDTDSVSSSDIKKTQAGGSTEQKAEKIKYIVAKNVKIGSVTDSISEVFSDAGFEFADFDGAVVLAKEELGSDISINMRSLAEEYVANEGTLTIDTKTEMSRLFKELKSIDVFVSYSVEIITDIGLAYTDSVTGNQKVDVSLNASIKNLKKRLGGKVGSVQITASGSGESAVTAAQNAVKNAATLAANKIVDTLNQKGIN